VLNFFKNKLTTIEENTKATYSEYQQEFKQAKNELNEFISNLKSHFIEEEQVVFPLALRADSI
jgi:hypothetical protein